MNPEERERLEKIAEHVGLSGADIVRMLIKRASEELEPEKRGTPRRFIKRAVTIEAAVWTGASTDAAPANTVKLWSERYPDDWESGRACHRCERPFREHGWVEVGGLVCVGDYVYESGDSLATTSKSRFEAEYELFQADR